MTAPVVVNSAVIPWAAAYPLALSGTFDTTGGQNLVLVYFFTASGGSWSTIPTATLGGVTGTLLTNGYTSGNTSSGVMWCWAFTGVPSSSSSALTISQSVYYANSGCAYIVSLSGAASTPIGATSTICNATPSATTTLVTTGGSSLVVGVGASCQAPACTVTGTPTPTDIIDNTTATANFGSLVTESGLSSGATASLTATAAYNYTNVTLIEVLGTSSGVSITSGPLSLTVSLGAESMSAPSIVSAPLSLSLVQNSGVIAGPTISVGPLSISTAIHTGTVLAPIVVTVSPLTLSVLLGAETVGVAGNIYVSPLSISVSNYSGSVITPPVISAGPLSLSESLGTGTVTASLVITAGPLSLTLGVYPGSVTDPLGIYAFPLSISMRPNPGSVINPVPPIVAAPLSLSIVEGSVVVVDQGSIVVSPLSLSIFLGSTIETDPPNIHTAPLSLAFTLEPVSLNVTGSALTPPFTLIASHTATVTVAFTPSALGARTGTITLVSNAPSSPNVVSLSGTGVTTTPPTVSLSVTSLTFPSTEV